MREKKGGLLRRGVLLLASAQRTSALSCNWMAVARAMLVPAARKCVVVGAVGEKAATDERPQAATKALRPRIVTTVVARAVVSFRIWIGSM